MLPGASKCFGLPTSSPYETDLAVGRLRMPILVFSPTETSRESPPFSELNSGMHRALVEETSGFAIGAAIYRSPEPSRPEIPKKSQQGVPGLQNLCSGTFSTLFWHPGRGGPEVLFETFWGFRGSGVSRLLYMGIAIESGSLLMLCHAGLGKT